MSCRNETESGEMKIGTGWISGQRIKVWWMGWQTDGWGEGLHAYI